MADGNPRVSIELSQVLDRHGITDLNRCFELMRACWQEAQRLGITKDRLGVMAIQVFRAKTGL